MAIRLNFLSLLVSLLSLGTIFNAADAQTKAHTTLEECLDAYTVTGLTPSDSSWSSTIAPYNLRLPWQPAGVAIPTTPEEVAAALSCAKKYKVKVQPRGGGHSYGAMSLGGKDGSLMIDMNRFNKIQLDNATKVAKVGAGVRLGNLATALYNQGGRALPHGTCPGVGIGGHATHGGYGLTSRMWGMTLDKIVKLDVVLPSGVITSASPTSNAELFWALRGAGSSMGIVTTFHLQTVPAPRTAISFSVDIPSTKSKTATQRTNIFLAMQEYGLKADEKIGLSLYTDVSTFAISGVYWGDLAGYRAAIAPLVKLLPAGTQLSEKSAGWLQTLKEMSYSPTLDVPLSGYDLHETFYAKSIVTSQSNPSTAKTITPFFDYLLTKGPKVDFAWWVLADLYGGKINAAPLGSSSYAHRDSLFTFQFYSNTVSHKPPYPSKGVAFMNSMVESMTSHMNPAQVKGYANYLDPTLSAAAAHQLYYGNDSWDGSVGGEGRLDKLKRIKRKVDPGNVLWNPQAIGA